MASAFPNIGFQFSEKELIREKNVGIFILEPARLLRAFWRQCNYLSANGERNKTVNVMVEFL